MEDDVRCFKAVYEQHYGAVADTFTIAWRRLPELPDGKAALPWLYGVARRVLANHGRRHHRRAPLRHAVDTGRRSPGHPGADATAPVAVRDRWVEDRP